MQSINSHPPNWFAHALCSMYLSISVIQWFVCVYSCDDMHWLWNQIHFALSVPTSYRSIFAALPPPFFPFRSQLRWLLILIFCSSVYAPFTIGFFSMLNAFTLFISNATHYYFNTVWNFRTRKWKQKSQTFSHFHCHCTIWPFLNQTPNPNCIMAFKEFHHIAMLNKLVIAIYRDKSSSVAFLFVSFIRGFFFWGHLPEYFGALINAIRPSTKGVRECTQTNKNVFTL